MIKNLFAKDIERNIEGVIKADEISDEIIQQEVEEYIITAELEQKLSKFFSIYKQNLDGELKDSGVWISGFFGSGKSHLLKVLSYILSGKEINGEKIGRKLLEKIEDFELKHNIEQALSIPCDTILFNIDQQADALNIKNKQLLEVFVKVFNKHRKYYHKVGYIAQLEKDLNKLGIFERFKDELHKLTNDSWENIREIVWFEMENFAKAMSKAKNISIDEAKKLIERYENNYHVSIEDFVEDVNEYLKTKPKNYRLHFMVDEVGQYIGNNSDLMLNLQTLIETLSTKTNGRVWLTVTSQDELEELIGIQNNHKKQDFSKILERFSIKLNLTSANANEVIQKRLLLKNSESERELKQIFDKIHNSLGSKIRFNKGAQYKSYIDEQDFAVNYPFIPYQSELLRSSLIGLSNNNAFQGRHQSIGERSMLKIFQEVLLDIKNQKVDTLVSYDKFYDGLNTILRTEIRVGVDRAENNLSDDFAIRVLKALFLVKYVKEFVPTVDNITTLMINNIDEDISLLKQRVQKALNILTEQVYIQKVGDNYEFLSDIEKDIENEIRNMNVEQSEINRELYEWLYDEIIKIPKIRHIESGYDYPFSKKMDDNILKGKENDLSLNILTPFYDIEEDEKIIAKSIASQDVIFKIPYDNEISKDIELYVKTKKFIPQKQSVSLADSERSLLIGKQGANSERKNRTIERLKQLLIDSDIYFNGKKLDMQSTDPRTKVEKALNSAIETIYPNLSMLKRIYKEEDVKNIISNSSDLRPNKELSEPEQECLKYIKRQEYSTMNISNVHEFFRKKPYGWYPQAINAILATLYSMDFIEFKQPGKALDKKESIEALNKTNQHHSTSIVMRKFIDEGVLKKVKQLFSEILPDVKTDGKEKEIYDSAVSQIKKELNKLQNYRQQYGNYPFVNDLDRAIPIYEKASKIPYDNFFEDILNMEDELMDIKEEIIEPLIIEFIESQAINIYETIIKFFNSNSDIIQELSQSDYDVLNDLKNDKKPYSGRKIQSSKEIYDKIKQQFDELLKKERDEAINSIDNYIKRLQDNSDFKNLKQEKGNNQKSAVLSELLRLKNRVTNSSDIYFIRLSKNTAEDLYLKALEKIDEIKIGNNKNAIIVKKVALSQLFPIETTLKNRDDVERFIEKLKENMLKTIEDKKEIIL